MSCAGSNQPGSTSVVNDFVSTKRELKDCQKSSHLRTELGGMPPLSVTLKSDEMATAIIRRAGVCRGTQLKVNINSSLIASFVLFF